MKTRRIQAFLTAALGTAGLALAAKPTPDIAPPDRRRAIVEIAQRLARPAAAPAPVADLVSPFSPPAFSKADPSAAPAAAKSGTPDAKPAPAAESDQDVLATVADKIPTTGTIILHDKPLLVSGTNRIEIGSHFTVVYNGQEYELVLTAIDRTTFTVRYKGEEFTRPIKLGKTP